MCLTSYRYLLLVLTLFITAVPFNVRRGEPRAPSPSARTHDVEALVARFVSAEPASPLHRQYRTLASCPHATDIPALRLALRERRPPADFPFVVCLHRLSDEYITLIRKLSARLGPPFITTADAHIVQSLLNHNITPITPSSPHQSLAAMANSDTLLVQPSKACAIGATLSNSVVYYIHDFHRYVTTTLGYEWLPAIPARLDNFDRKHKAVLNSLGRVHHSCCTFNQGICHPTSCRAFLIGNFDHDELNCKIVADCTNYPDCPWRQLLKTANPNVLILDIRGLEFALLKQIPSATPLPDQIVVRMAIWAPANLGPPWVKTGLGWGIIRPVLTETVRFLSESGFRLVHRVDDPSCDWCTFVTFLRD